MTYQIHKMLVTNATPWLLLLIVITAGLASVQQSARVIAPWIRHHASALRQGLSNLSRLPSETSIIARTIHQINISVLERVWQL